MTVGVVCPNQLIAHDGVRARVRDRRVLELVCPGKRHRGDRRVQVYEGQRLRHLDVAGEPTQALPQLVDGGAVVRWTVEGARLNHFEAGADDVTFLTAGLAWQRNRWNVAIAGAMRNHGTNQVEDTRDTLLQLSAEYAFEPGLSVEIGWRGGRGDVADQTIGAVIAYDVEF